MQNKIEHYLLGNLNEAEAEEMDLQIISGAIAEEELCMAEDNLIESYLDGMLAPPEIELFEKNFLVSDERKSNLEHLSLLKSYARNYTQNEIKKKILTLKTNGFLEKLKSFFILNLRPTVGLVIFMILGLAVGFYIYRSGDNEIARLNKKDLSSLASYQHLSSLSLVSGTFRGANESSTLYGETLTNEVLLRLVLPIAVKFDGGFKIKIVKEQIDISAINQISYYENQSAQELRLLIPSSLLTKGDYKIEVVPENEKNMIITYTFTVK